MNRKDIADLILPRLQPTASGPGYFLVDDLLPTELAMSVFQAFPAESSLMLRKSIRELKYVTSQMNRCAPLLEECVFAFQDPRVVQAVGELSGLQDVEPDEKLYAGGISAMGQGHFLRPHLDNSHDMDRKRYRALNLLYYSTPDWPENAGGNFELWPNGFTQPLTIHSKFNRLLVIHTNRTSWHSVSKITIPRVRTCVSNYYFSPLSPEGEDYFHVTSFRGRPEEPLTDIALRADALLRGAIRKISKKGLVKTRHYYAKS